MKGRGGEGEKESMYVFTQTVDTNPLPRWEVHHLALQGEVIPCLGAAQDALTRRADNFYAEVVKLEGIGGGWRWGGHFFFFFSSLFLLPLLLLRLGCVVTRLCICR